MLLLQNKITTVIVMSSTKEIKPRKHIKAPILFSVDELKKRGVKKRCSGLDLGIWVLEIASTYSYTLTKDSGLTKGSMAEKKILPRLFLVSSHGNQAK